MTATAVLFLLLSPQDPTLDEIVERVERGRGAAPWTLRYTATIERNPIFGASRAAGRAILVPGAGASLETYSSFGLSLISWSRYTASADAAVLRSWMDLAGEGSFVRADRIVEDRGDSRSYLEGLADTLSPEHTFLLWDLSPRALLRLVEPRSSAVSSREGRPVVTLRRPMDMGLNGLGGALEMRIEIVLGEDDAAEEIRAGFEPDLMGGTGSTAARVTSWTEREGARWPERLRVEWSQPGMPMNYDVVLAYGEIARGGEPALPADAADPLLPDGAPEARARYEAEPGSEPLLVAAAYAAASGGLNVLNPREETDTFLTDHADALRETARAHPGSGCAADIATLATMNQGDLDQIASWGEWLASRGSGGSMAAMAVAERLVRGGRSDEGFRLAAAVDDPLYDFPKLALEVGHGMADRSPEDLRAWVTDLCSRVDPVVVADLLEPPPGAETAGLGGTAPRLDARDPEVLRALAAEGPPALRLAAARALIHGTIPSVMTDEPADEPPAEDLGLAREALRALWDDAALGPAARMDADLLASLPNLPADEEMLARLREAGALGTASGLRYATILAERDDLDGAAEILRGLEASGGGGSAMAMSPATTGAADAIEPLRGMTRKFLDAGRPEDARRAVSLVMGTRTGMIALMGASEEGVSDWLQEVYQGDDDALYALLTAGIGGTNPWLLQQFGLTNERVWAVLQAREEAGTIRPADYAIGAGLDGVAPHDRLEMIRRAPDEVKAQASVAAVHGQLAYADGAYGEAMDAFARAMTGEPAASAMSMAVIRGIAQPAQTLAQYLQGGGEPDDVIGYPAGVQYAFAARRAERREEAVEFLRGLDSEPAADRGMAFELLGSTADAIRAYRTALREDAAPQGAAAYVMMMRGQGDEAEWINRLADLLEAAERRIDAYVALRIGSERLEESRREWIDTYGAPREEMSATWARVMDRVEGYDADRSFLATSFLEAAPEPTEEVRRAVAEASANLGSPDPSTREEATHRLRELGPSAARPLGDVLRSDNAEASGRAAQLIAEWAYPYFRERFLNAED